MSYADYAKQLSRMAWATAAFVHERIAPSSQYLVQQAGAQWRPLQTVLDVSGPTVFAYVVELLLVYLCAYMVILVVRTVSGTLYRFLRFVFGVLVFVTAVALGVYFYLMSTAKGQQIGAYAGGFWADQAAAVLGRLAALGGPQAAGWQAGRAAQWRNQPPPVNFQYQPPGH
ncbi:hypothetical protein LPJ61_000389 [Coemansia biformis]|uniref:Uncharacterized protein n=1 Tax=Coemansia biformis TaxID=1286918 RepID=A0A9W7YBT6_9FUNG|nr:hypothetical protein LPJ61_000389 [Coemansia biformis]